MAKAQGNISYELVRFNLISPNFNPEIVKITEEWAFNVENEVKLRLSSGGKPSPESRNLLRSIRHDLKGGIKTRVKKTPKNFESPRKNIKIDKIILRMKAGSGESIHDRGSPGDPFYAPQALLLERGGIVTPKTTSKLFIPLNNEHRGMGKMLMASGTTTRIGNVIFRFGGEGDTGGVGFGEAIAVLKSFVYIPPHPYMMPVIKKELPKLRKSLKAIIAKDIETK